MTNLNDPNVDERYERERGVEAVEQPERVKPPFPGPTRLEALVLVAEALQAGGEITDNQLEMALTAARKAKEFVQAFQGGNAVTLWMHGQVAQLERIRHARGISEIE